MPSVTVVVPTYRRHERLTGVADNIIAHGGLPLFVVEADDIPSVDVPKLVSDGGSYAAAMNLAATVVTTPFLFTGADDLVFTEGWLEAAMRHMEDGVEVVGVNDGKNNATHFLVRTGYQGVFDGPGLMHEYHHNYCDTELREYAIHKGVYRYAPDSRVEHQHWIWGLAQKDATYRKGLSKLDLDRATFRRRSSQWGVTARS